LGNFITYSARYLTLKPSEPYFLLLLLLDQYCFVDNINERISHHVIFIGDVLCYKKIYIKLEEIIFKIVEWQDDRTLC
jgi:hypothetical protein